MTEEAPDDTRPRARKRKDRLNVSPVVIAMQARETAVYVRDEQEGMKAIGGEGGAPAGRSHRG